MATLAKASTARTREHRFFLLSAIAMALVDIAGFSLNFATGRSSLSLPLVYHLHGTVFLSWIILYVAQNFLIYGGAVRGHRQLGWLALALLPLMAVLGIGITILSARHHGGPPILDLNSFLIGNPVGILYFVTISSVAIALRRRTDWHRRLMFCGMAALTGPGFGRLLPMPFLIPWGWWAAALIAPSIFPVIAMVAERRRTGRVHPAWIRGWGAFVASFLLAEAFAFSTWGIALTHAVVAGTPGAARPMAAFFPG